MTITDCLLRRSLKRQTLPPLGFIPFIAPEEFTSPEQYADFGLEVNIHDIYRRCKDKDKAYIYAFAGSNDIDPDTNEPVTSPVSITRNATNAISKLIWSEQIDGIQQPKQVALLPAIGSIATIFSEGSTHRWAIFLSDKLVIQTPEMSTVIYALFGKKSIYITTLGRLLRFVFQVDLNIGVTGTVYQGNPIGTCQGIIKIPPSLTNLGGLTFSYSKIEGTLHIPSTVTAIGSRCFHGCSLITEVICDANINRWNYYGSGSNGNPFIGCRGITSLIINSPITTATGLSEGMAFFISVNKTLSLRITNWQTQNNYFEAYMNLCRTDFAVDNMYLNLVGDPNIPLEDRKPGFWIPSIKLKTLDVTNLIARYPNAIEEAASKGITII